MRQYILDRPLLPQEVDNVDLLSACPRNWKHPAQLRVTGVGNYQAAIRHPDGLFVDAAQRMNGSCAWGANLQSVRGDPKPRSMVFECPARQLRQGLHQFGLLNSGLTGLMWYFRTGFGSTASSVTLNAIRLDVIVFFVSWRERQRHLLYSGLFPVTFHRTLP